MSASEPKYYDELWMHREMLKDQVRCESYREAIRRTVKPGHAVLDVGAGTGILSMFAAEAGARAVYAVERTGMSRLASRIVMANGYGDRIQIIRSDIEDVNLPEKVDVIVSEWMGGFAVDENLLHPVLQARDRWLKPGGRLVPGVVDVLVAPAFDAKMEEALVFWGTPKYGLDLSAIAEHSTHEVHNARHDIGPCEILAAPEVMWHIDASSFSAETADQPFVFSKTFVANREGRMVCLAAWFRADLHPEVVLTNGPEAPKTHWGRTGLPLRSAIKVQPGSKIDVEVECIPAGQNLCDNTWSVRVDGGDWQRYSGRQGCVASPGFH